MSEVVLSGIRPTGSLHLGNFIGAIQHFVEFQKGDNQCLYFVADWHSITTDHKPERLRGRPVEVVKDYIAAGLDPERSTIYVQSSVPELLELMWYLAMLQMVPGLQTDPHYTEHLEKIAAGKENQRNNNLALFSYSVLMTADILGTRATLVPVGKDQKIHVRMAGELAERFNREYGELFPVPRTIVQMIKLPGFDGKKMGKSDNNTVFLHSSRDEITRQYLERGITDENRKLASDPGDPQDRCKSVYPVHELVTEGEVESREIATLCRNAEITCVACKHRLANSIWKMLAPFQERRRAIREEDVVEILHEGGRKARAIVRATVEEVRERVGVRIH